MLTIFSNKNATAKHFKKLHLHALNVVVATSVPPSHNSSPLRSNFQKILWARNRQSGRRSQSIVPTRQNRRRIVWHEFYDPFGVYHGKGCPIDQTDWPLNVHPAGFATVRHAGCGSVANLGINVTVFFFFFARSSFVCLVALQLNMHSTLTRLMDATRGCRAAANWGINRDRV